MDDVLLMDVINLIVLKKLVMAFIIVLSNIKKQIAAPHDEFIVNCA